MPEPDLITTAEAAKILGTTVSTLNRWAKSRKLTPVHETEGRGGFRLFDRADVLALAAPQPTEAAS